ADFPQLSRPFSIKALNTIEEVGVEDILFTSNWENYPETFVHHKDDIHDYGWSAVRFEYVKNGWMRNCRFTSWSEVVDVRQSIGISVDNVVIDGKKGHASFLTRRSYGLLVKDCEDHASQFHGPGTGYAGVNTVYLRCRMNADQSVDAHSGQPYTTLIDDVEGGVFDRNGGPHESFPHHARDMVFWNFRHNASNSKSYNFWSLSRNGNTYAEPIFVGFQANNGVSFQNEGLNQMEGVMVEPRSLFEAQLALRLQRQNAPQISFVSPAAESQFPINSNVRVEITATDPDGEVTFAALYINDELIRQIAEPPFVWGEEQGTDPGLAGLSAGEYVLRVVVGDDNDNQSTSEISILVGERPTLEILRPETTKIVEVGESVEVEVTAADPDGNITQVDLYFDDVLVSSKSESPFLWGANESQDMLLHDLAAGEHRLKAVATDNDGLTSEETRSFVVNMPPNVQISTPEDASVYEPGVNIRINAGASDADGAIATVKLYLNETFLRQDQNLPYTWGFDEGRDPQLFNMPAGDYEIRVEATDNRGSKASDTIRVSVQVPLNAGSAFENTVNIYPNPFDDEVNIALSSHAMANSVKMLDQFGREIVVSYEYSETILNVVPDQVLSPGIYFLELIIHSDKRVVYKVFKR
ncbi:MAG: DUF4955 domain-containing protein, partial [Bacteroidota bacterium]